MVGEPTPPRLAFRCEGGFGEVKGTPTHRNVTQRDGGGGGTCPFGRLAEGEGVLFGRVSKVVKNGKKGGRTFTPCLLPFPCSPALPSALLSPCSPGVGPLQVVFGALQ